MKKRLIAWVLLIALCFTGCSGGEDFISEVISKNNPGTVYVEIPQENNSHNMVNADGKTIKAIYDVLKNTSIKEYMVLHENRFEIDTQLYFQKYIEQSNRHTVDITNEERIKLLNGDSSVWDEYNLIIDKDIVYLENSDKEIVENYFFVFLSENEEIKKVLVDGGYELIYLMYEFLDEQFKKALEDDKTYVPLFVGNVFNCVVEYSYFTVSFYMTDVTIPKETEYLAELYQNDVWVITGGGVNQSCETLSMLYSRNEEYVEGSEEFNIRADLFGSDGELKEIKLIYGKSLSTIPKFCHATLTKGLYEMGCSDKAITDFLKEMPAETGKIDNLYFITEKIDEDNRCIKLYVK